MLMKNKRLALMLTAVLGILAVPMVAMQFTAEVNWTLFDFSVAAVLLLGTVFGIELILQKVKGQQYQTAFSVACLAMLLLVWAELAVGIFGTAIGGN